MAVPAFGFSATKGAGMKPTSLEINFDSAEIMQFTSAGVAITGTLSVSGQQTFAVGPSVTTGDLEMVAGTLDLQNGGTVTQATNRSTGVTLSTMSGQITMNGASLAAAAEVTFTVTNTLVSATDVIILSQSAQATGTPFAFVSDVSAGSFDITVTNLHASEADTTADVIHFAVIKGASS